jgi:hypothetical protein
MDYTYFGKAPSDTNWCSDYQDNDIANIDTDSMCALVELTKEAVKMYISGIPSSRTDSGETALGRKIRYTLVVESTLQEDVEFATKLVAYIFYKYSGQESAKEKLRNIGDKLDSYFTKAYIDSFDSRRSNVGDVSKIIVELLDPLLSSVKLFESKLQIESKLQTGAYELNASTSREFFRLLYQHSIQRDRPAKLAIVNYDFDEKRVRDWWTEKGRVDTWLFHLGDGNNQFKDPTFLLRSSERFTPNSIKKIISGFTVLVFLITLGTGIVMNKDKIASCIHNTSASSTSTSDETSGNAEATDLQTSPPDKHRTYLTNPSHSNARKAAQPRYTTYAERDSHRISSLLFFILTRKVTMYTKFPEQSWKQMVCNLIRRKKRNSRREKAIEILTI